MEEFTATTNWTVKDSRNVCETFTSNTNHLPVEDALSSVTPNTCICLVQDTNTSSPEIFLKIERNIIVLEITSEAQIVEFFGSSGEYVSTHHAEFLDDCEGLAVYHVRIETQSLSKCSLKFKKLKEPDRLWVYNINMGFEKYKDSPLPQMTTEISSNQNTLDNLFQLYKSDDVVTNSTKPMFNPIDINRLLEKSTHQISDKAEKFKSLFQLYSLSKKGSETPKNIIPPPQVLLRMLESEYGSQINDCQRSMASCLNTLQFPAKTRSGTEKEVQRSLLQNTFSEVVPCTVTDKTIELTVKNIWEKEIKTYMDEKFAEIERNLKLQMNEQLDCIRRELAQLSYSSSQGVGS